MVRMMETLLPKPPLTSDQLVMLQSDNVTDNALVKQNFKVDWIPIRDGIREYAFYRE